MSRRENWRSWPRAYWVTCRAYLEFILRRIDARELAQREAIARVAAGTDEPQDAPDWGRP